MSTPLQAGPLRAAAQFLAQVARTVRGLVVGTLVGAVRAYQRWISPGLAPRCRFYPSCSAYAVQALIDHGLARGSALAVRRLLRCHPWNPGGPDPVPLPRPPGDGRPAPLAASPSTIPGA